MNFRSFLLNIVEIALANLKKPLIIFYNPKSHFNNIKTVFICLTVILTSCSVTRNVEEGELLLNKVKIEVADRNLKPALNSLVKQQENRKILWIYRFRLRFYSSFIFKKDSESGLRLSIGEMPVLYDSLSSKESVKQMHAFLKNKGFYHNEVHYVETRRREKNKKIKVKYIVDLKEPTTIAEIKIDVDTNNLAIDLNREREKSHLKVGDNFDIDELEKERLRLTRIMQEEGYYYFSNDLLFYHADTIREKNKVFLSYRLKEKAIKYVDDSIKVNPYITYKVKNVFVRQDYGEDEAGITGTDTSFLFDYHFINPTTFFVKPKAISRSIFHKEGDYYILSNHEDTYRRLTALNNFKYVNISYNTAQDSLPNYLNCLVSLAPTQPKSFSVETNGTNTGGILGVNGTFSISHRNVFRGSELLRFSLYAGMEAQSVKSDDDIIENTPFNTLEVGPEVSLVLPKFLLPINKHTFAKKFVPKTTFTLSYNYQRRPDYTRNIVNAGLIYSWKESRTKSHAIQPINISNIQIFKSADFQARLDSLDNSSLKASYEDNFISSIMYSFVYNDQVINQGKTHFIFRANAEFAGNLIYTIDKNYLNRPTDENGSYTINNIPYAQFVRVYTEFVPNIYINRANQVVSRTFIGVGVPYNNSSSMPFVRSFYGGGTNGIRAWQARSLGPGSISNEDLAEANVDQIGDIKIEQNLEYRFKIVKYLEGALFADIGNIWVLDNPDYGEAGNFRFDKLWKDLAIANGIGLRLNFEYFVIRLDAAKRMKDPGAEDPFAIKFYYSEPPVYNFAIGYPF